MKALFNKCKMLRNYARTFLIEIRRLNNDPGASSFLHYIRYFPRYCKYANKVDQVLVNDMPWFNFGAIDFLNSVLTKDMMVFEYGSGGSTLYISSRVKKLRSVEHDKEWFDRVRREIEARNIVNSCVLLRESEPATSTSSYDDPESCVSLSKFYQGQSFSKYVHCIDEADDRDFDVVILDGRARPSSFEASYKKVKRGGYLILDNSEREQYRYIHSTLDNPEWQKISFFGPGPYVRYFWGTTFWQRQ